MANLTEEERLNIERLAKDKNKKRLLKAGKYLSRAGQVGALLAGRPDLAEELREGVHGFKEAGSGHEGAGRKAASNIAGSQAGKFASGRGLARKIPGASKVGKLSGGKSAALGGAVSSALQGEGAVNIAKGAASWYFLYIAFGALFTFAGSIPAFLYLNFHFIMSKLGSKIFGEMSLLQKIGLAAVDFTVLILVLLLIAIPISIAASCNAGSFTGSLARFASVAGSFGLGPFGDFCKAFAGLIPIATTIDQFVVPGPPVTNINISQWDTQIRTAAAGSGLPYCYVHSFLEKESGGNPLAIGHNHTQGPVVVRWRSPDDGIKAYEPGHTPDAFNISTPPKYNINWDFSHDIGLMQINVPSYNSRDWSDPNNPGREMPPGSGKKYTVAELLDPNKSISAAVEYLAQLVRQHNNNFQAAAAAYNGSGTTAQVYGQDIMSRNIICLKNV